ncbi:MAG: hypothetical protein SNJ59_08380 [Aggregatilineales bacterium]
MNGYSNHANGWLPYQDGKTIGRTGAEGGIIKRDEEHADGARITLEQETLHRVPFAITCGIYGWLVHTRFFADEPTAVDAYEQMKTDLASILALMAAQSDPEGAADAVSAAIESFVERYP